ncbi:MAG: hypothetical protein ACRDBP_16285 [Luteolibacter sp.]
MADAAVAERLATSLLQVETTRNRQGIPPYAPQVQLHIWQPEHDAMLGVKFDSEIAALLGVSKKTVAARRAALGIPRQRGSGSKKGGHIPRTPEEIWTADAIAKLGTTSDSTLAAILRIHSFDIRARREELGIPRWVVRHPYKREWTADELALIGNMTDTAIAKKLGISRAQVEVRRKSMGLPRHIPEKPERIWPPEHDAMLGVKTDSEVAALLGIPRRVVETRRNKLQIPRQYKNRKPTLP